MIQRDSQSWDYLACKSISSIKLPIGKDKAGVFKIVSSGECMSHTFAYARHTTHPTQLPYTTGVEQSLNIVTDIS